MLAFEFEHPYVTTEMALFRIQKNTKIRSYELRLEILLTEEVYGDEKEPIWALPGGFLSMDETPETLEENVMQKLFEKTGVTCILYQEQLYTKRDVSRDNRGCVISCSYLGITRDKFSPDSLKSNSAWYNVSDVLNMELAFDHAATIDYALKRMASKVLYTNIPFAFLPQLFTVDDLSQVYTLILGRPVGNLRRKIGHMLEVTDQYETGVAKRPALLHRRNDAPFIKM